MARRRTTYTQQTDGDVVVIPRDGWYKIACCDCGLTHNFTFKVFTVPGRKRPRVGFKAWRDARATAALRRQNPYVARIK